MKEETHGRVLATREESLWPSHVSKKNYSEWDGQRIFDPTDAFVVEMYDIRVFARS